ncbi:MAG: TetR/AcrR family transcriptional regulator [Desulfobacterales bacterium]|nr:MAG: TetR/AcrR family transcriptional regulator [Desulfobacterales bacterium]
MTVSDQLKADKRSRIVEAAARVFASKGYAGAVVADIAIQAEIGKGTIYEYFDSKEDLFFAVFEWYLHRTGSAAMVSIGALGGSAAERLQALSASLMNLWDEIRDVFALVMEFWAASSSSQMRQRFKDAFRQGYDQYRALVASLIRDGMQRGEFRPDVDIESVAAALVGTWDALLLQAWFDSRFDPIAAANGFIDVVIQGMASTRQT